MRGLLAQGALVEEIAEYAEGEDRYCETIATVSWVTTGELGEDLVVVFWGSLDEVEGEVRRVRIP